MDGVDYFIVDVYTRDLKKHCDELYRIAKASRAVHRPLDQIFNNDKKIKLDLNLNELCGIKLANGKAMFGPEKAQVKEGFLTYTLPPAGSGIWIFRN